VKDHVKIFALTRLVTEETSNSWQVVLSQFGCDGRKVFPEDLELRTVAPFAQWLFIGRWRLPERVIESPRVGNLCYQNSYQLANMFIGIQ
jgi:hypothetical protein